MQCLCHLGLDSVLCATTLMSCREQPWTSSRRHRGKLFMGGSYENWSRSKHDDQDKPCSSPLDGKRRILKTFQFYILQAGKAKRAGHPPMKWGSQELSKQQRLQLLWFPHQSSVVAPVTLPANAGSLSVPCRLWEGVSGFSSHPQDSFSLLVFGRWYIFK